MYKLLLFYALNTMKIVVYPKIWKCEKPQSKGIKFWLLWIKTHIYFFLNIG